MATVDVISPTPLSFYPGTLPYPTNSAPYQPLNSLFKAPRSSSPTATSPSTPSITFKVRNRHGHRHGQGAYTKFFISFLEQESLHYAFKKPCLLMPFVDVIFILWSHGPNSLTQFVKRLNDCYLVRLTWHTSPPKSHFWTPVCA